MADRPRAAEVIVPAGGFRPPTGGLLAAAMAPVAAALRQPADLALWEAEWELEPGDGDE